MGGDHTGGGAISLPASLRARGGHRPGLGRPPTLLVTHPVAPASELPPCAGRAGPQLSLTRGSLKYMSLRSSMVNQRFRKPSVCCGSERACDWQVSRGRPASSRQQHTPEGRVQASPGQSPPLIHICHWPCHTRPLHTPVLPARVSHLHSRLPLATPHEAPAHANPPASARHLPLAPPGPPALPGPQMGVQASLMSPHTCTSAPGPPRLPGFPSPSHIMPQGVARRGPLAARVHNPVGEEAGRTEQAGRV